MILKSFRQLFTKKKKTASSRLSPDHLAEGKDIAEDKRLAPRIDVSVPVAVLVKENSLKWCQGKVINYSYSGIRLKTPFVIRQGAQVNIDLKLPNVNDPLTLSGLVIWNSVRKNKTGTDIESGISFQDLHVRRVNQRDKLIFFLSNQITGAKQSLHSVMTTAAAQNVEDLMSCYRLVYDAYSEKGYCAEKNSRLHFTHHCFFPKSRTFLLKEKDKLKGTVSLIPDSPGGLPLDSVFPNELAWLRGLNKKVAEISLLAIEDEGARRRFPLTQFEKQSILFFLFKIMYEYARREEGITDFIIGVHPKHETLYKNLLFNSLAPAKSYGAVNGHPVILLHLNLLRAEQMWPVFLKVFMAGNVTSNEIVDPGLSMTPDIIQKFVRDDPSAWDAVPQAAKHYLLASYPGLTA